MIEITTCTPRYQGIRTFVYTDVFKAVRFVKKMIREGYKILEYTCDDPEDMETLEGAMR